MIVRRCKIMGILNVTPDSFFDGGRYGTMGAALAQADRMAEQGAELFDVGGESTRPGSGPVSVNEEITRVVPVIRALRVRHPGIEISVDTRKHEVAVRALDAGADIVNDISALRHDPRMADIVRERKAGLILMHMRGTPETMQRAPRYRDATREVRRFLGERLRFAVSKGVRREKIWIDPGIGFGKTVDHNLELLANLRDFESLRAPVLIGASRKSFLGKLLGKKGVPLDVRLRLPASLAAAAWSFVEGASVLRVHDVAATKNVLRVLEQNSKIRHT